MFRKGAVVLVSALALAACGEEVIPDPADEPDVAVDEEAEDEPGEDLDDCADVTASEGAPAGLTMMDSFFEPPCLAISSTQQITLTNAGNLEHNFSVAEDIDIDVESGEEVTTEEIGTDLPAGTYRFYCEYHEEEGMVGTLVVE